MLVETLTYIVLVPMVYLAATVFIFGTGVRLVKLFRAPKPTADLRIHDGRKPGWLGALHDAFLFPTVRRHRPLLWIFLILFHLCLLLLIFGHLELFAEIDILQIVPHEIFLGQGLVGLLTGAALLYFLFRRFGSPVRDLSVPEDYYLLILLFLIVVFGFQMDVARNWYYYDTVTVEDYRAYLGGLMRLHTDLPQNMADGGHAFMLVLHVFLANLFLIFFPFSHSMHAFLSLPLNKLRRG